MRKGNNKKPKFNNPDPQKKIQQERINSKKKVKYQTDPSNYDKLNPSWRFCKVSKGGKWDVSKDNWNVFVEKVLPKLHSFEGMNWAEIKVVPKDGKNGGNKHHNISIEDFTSQGKREYEKQNMHYDEMFSIRLSNKERLFGILEKGVFHIVWYDPNHEIAKIKNN